MYSQPLMRNEAVEISSRSRRESDLDCENASISHIIALPPEGETVVSFPSKAPVAEDSSGDDVPIDEVLQEAISIHHKLEGGASLVRLATKNKDIHSFGMGRFFHNIMRKNLLKDPEMTPEDLAEIACRRDIRYGTAMTLNRHRLITTLKEADVFVPTQNDRVLKPVGTTPSLRAIGALVEDFILREENVRVSLEEMTSASRVRDLVKARFVAIWVMRQVCGHSLSLIGTHMGNRDHTTILNSLNNTIIKMKADEGYAEQMNALCEKADTIGVMQNRMMLRIQSR